MTVSSLIQMAGGLKVGASPTRIEVSRRIIGSDVTSVSAQSAVVFNIDLDEDLSNQDSSNGFKLQPFVIVYIRIMVGYETQMQVRVEGEVLYPGTYTLTKKNERISDVIKRAGGLTAFAYEDGTSLKRPGPLESSNKEGFTGIEEEEEAKLANLQR